MAKPKTEIKIDRDTVIEQFNLVAAVLTELGYEGFYDYDTLKYNDFVDQFKSTENHFAIAGDYHYKIDPNILSDFYLDFDSEPVDDLSGMIFSSLNNFIITGEGGIGKSTILRHIHNKFNEENKFLEKKLQVGEQEVRSDLLSIHPIPVLIPASKLHIGDYLYNLDDFENDIKGLYRSEESFYHLVEKLSDSYDTLMNNDDKPLFILLIDGFNEIKDLDQEDYIQFSSIFEELSQKRIQIIITSRKGYFHVTDNNNFKEVYAKGLSDDKIIRFISGKNSSGDAGNKNKPENEQLLDVLKNPMMLTLYTGCQYNPGSQEYNDIQELISTNQLFPIEGGIPNKSSIVWNYIQYNLLYANVYKPILEERRNRESNNSRKRRDKKFDPFERNQLYYAEILTKIIPLFAWEMVSEGLYEKSYNPNEFLRIKEISNLSDNSDLDFDNVIDYLANNICLIKYEDESLSFVHQIYRDFFAACHYITKYDNSNMHLKSEPELNDMLKEDHIPSDIKIFTGELLQKLGDGNDPLSDILKKYRTDYNSSDPEDDYTVENIFEIYKATGTLNLSDFINTDLEKLNFNDIKIESIIRFIDDTLNNISLDDFLSEIMPFNKTKNEGTINKVKTLFLFSARYANNLKIKDINEIYKIWLRWARNVYNNDTAVQARSLFSKVTYKVISNKKFSTSVLTNIMYPFLDHGNVGVGNNKFTNIFYEVSESKSDYQKLTALLKPEGYLMKNDEIISPMYNLASRNDYASNYVCFILDYYLYNNLEEGLDLVTKIQKEMEKETDPDKYILLKFRMMSGINFCLQESLCHNKIYLKPVFKEKFKPIMNEFLDQELDNFSEEIAGDYKKFKYNYYFPFGILFSFDNGIDDSETTIKTIGKIFPDDGSFNLLLYQKVILDIAIFSTSTFFVQNLFSSNEGNDIKYLNRTYNFFGDLIKKMYSYDFANSFPDNNDYVWESLNEALALLHYCYPLRTEKFLTDINKEYFSISAKDSASKENKNKIMSLKSSLKQTTEKKLTLCEPDLNKKEFTIKGFLENYKNALVFADLANNVFISCPGITRSLARWGDDSFFKNIDDYKKDPKKFIHQTLNEVISLLDSDHIDLKSWS